MLRELKLQSNLHVKVAWYNWTCNWCWDSSPSLNDTQSRQFSHLLWCWDVRSFFLLLACFFPLFLLQFITQTISQSGPGISELGAKNKGKVECRWLTTSDVSIWLTASGVMNAYSFSLSLSFFLSLHAIKDLVSGRLVMRFVPSLDTLLSLPWWHKVEQLIPTVTIGHETRCGYADVTNGHYWLYHLTLKRERERERERECLVKFPLKWS